MTGTPGREHGGGLDAAIARHGGSRAEWIDLSTGINPQPYPLPELAPDCWHALPDSGAQQALERAARRFWNIPEGLSVLAAPGASALITRIPFLMPAGTVSIPGPTYNEHEAAFAGAGWRIGTGPMPDSAADALVLVHPNNPDGRLHPPGLAGRRLTVIDESFCDLQPDASHVGRALPENAIVLKSFGKFWGLAGLRLGFAIGRAGLLARLGEALGPWPVSGPALAVGTAALSDPGWAERTRLRLARDATRLDALMLAAGARPVGGTSLFRLYAVADAGAWQARLARRRIWTRRFGHIPRWLRLGLPAPAQWPRLEAAL